MLEDKYGSRYQEIRDKFPDIEIIPLRASKQLQEKRTVIVNREDTTTTKDKNGKVIAKKVEHFRYVWIDDGSGMTEDQVREKFAPLAHKIGEEMWLANDVGELIRVEEPKCRYTHEEKEGE
jgi:hypothetical protein